MRIGVLGGTFDPVHLGHLRIAEEVGEEFGLGKVYLIPAALPPHKDLKPITPFHHRFKMIHLAAMDSPMLEALDLEGRRQGLSYSIETLKELHRIFESTVELFFIIGTDAFLEIETWKDYKNLFDYSHFVVIKRPGVQDEELETFVLSLQMGFKREEEKNAFFHPSGMALFYNEPTLMDLSSTQIRELVNAGKSIRFLVPEPVRAYILEKGLYRIHGHP